MRDLEIKEGDLNVRILGSILIALSGFVLYSDKVLFFELENNFGYKNTGVLIWVVSQTLSPILLIFGLMLRGYLTSALIPLYCYTIQFVWIFDSSMKIDDPLLHTYALGSCALSILLVFIIGKLRRQTKVNRAENEAFIAEAKQTINLLRQQVLKEM